MVVTLRHALAGACALALALPATTFAGSAPIERLAGTGTPALYQAANPAGSEQPAFATPFRYADGVGFDAGNGVYFADPLDNRVFRIQSGSLILVAGDGSTTTTNGNAKTNGAPSPTGVALYGIGALRFTQAVVLTSQGALRSYASLGETMSTLFEVPGAFRDLSVDGSGDGYIADSGLNKIKTTGNVTVAGDGGVGGSPPLGTDPLSGDVGSPKDVAIDPNTTTTFLFTSTGNAGGDSIWKVTGAGSAATDNIVKLSGDGTNPGIGDGGLASGATLSNPTSILRLPSGAYLVYDAGHARIRRVTGTNPATSTISTIAGNGTVGLAPAGTPANQAALAADGDLALSPDGLIVSQGPAAVVEMIPATAITSRPDALTNSSTATFGLASWDDSASYKCTLDGGAPQTCANGVSYPGLVDGSHTMSVKATTNGGVIDSSPAIATWTVDTTLPATFDLVAPDEGAVGGPSFSWHESSDLSGIARYEVWIDGVKTNSPDIKCDGGLCTGTPPEVGDGPHTWQVKAVDSADNVRESGVRTFTRLAPPSIVVAIAPGRALVGRTVTFDASASTDPNGSIVRFEWDLNGDGSFERDTGATPTTTSSYAKPQTLTISVRATDNSGNSSVGAGQLVVTLVPPTKQLGVSINDGDQYTNDPNVVVFAVWPSFASDALLSNDGGFKKAESLPVAEQVKWKLDSSGPERLPKTIYVRFTSGAQISETFQDDIILDETPPKVLAAELAAAPAIVPAAAAKAKLVPLKVKAKDNLSGVGRIQVTSNKRKPGKLLKFKRTLKVKPAKVIYVRVRDRAGNLSRWRTATRR